MQFVICKFYDQMEIKECSPLKKTRFPLNGKLSALYFIALLYESREPFVWKNRVPDPHSPPVTPPLQIVRMKGCSHERVFSDFLKERGLTNFSGGKLFYSHFPPYARNSVHSFKSLRVPCLNPNPTGLFLI